jgi:hypothetical protein
MAQDDDSAISVPPILPFVLIALLAVLVPLVLIVSA